MIVIIGFVLERQPCLSEWQVAESIPVTPNDSDQEYALNITPEACNDVAAIFPRVAELSRGKRQ